MQVPELMYAIVYMCNGCAVRGRQIQADVVNKLMQCICPGAGRKQAKTLLPRKRVKEENLAAHTTTQDSVRMLS